jgi:hypothetical protein
MVAVALGSWCAAGICGFDIQEYGLVALLRDMQVPCGGMGLAQKVNREWAALYEALSQPTMVGVLRGYFMCACFSHACCLRQILDTEHA